VIGLADLPNGWIYSTPPSNWGPVPVEAWVLAGILYIAGVAVARVAVPNVKRVLGFARFALEEEPSPAPVATGSGA
jgi:hypothetical protein